MAVARFSNQLLATTAPADIVTQPQAAQAALLAESRPASPSARARRPRLAGLAARQCPGHSSGEPAAWESPNRRNRSERLLAAAAAAPTWAPGQVRARALARSGFTRSPRPAEAAAARQFSGFTGNALLAAGHDSLRPLAALKSITAAGPQRTGLLARSGWQPVSDYACCLPQRPAASADQARGLSRCCRSGSGFRVIL